MDLDDDLTTEDLLFLDSEVQKEIDKHNDSSSVRLPKPDIPKATDDVECIQNTQFLQMVSDCFDDDGTEAQMEHLECLRSKFKHGSFREKQWDIIKALSEKRDVCAVMATGYGKSLCFQFPAVYMNKMTLVVSPLIALMQAQVMDLQTIGISACMVGSAQKDLKILNRIAEGNFTVIYSSPEYLQTTSGDKLMSIVRGKLALIAIDEAHVSFFFYFIIWTANSTFQSIFSFTVRKPMGTRFPSRFSKIERNTCKITGHSHSSRHCNGYGKCATRCHWSSGSKRT